MNQALAINSELNIKNFYFTFKGQDGKIIRCGVTPVRLDWLVRDLWRMQHSMGLKGFFMNKYSERKFYKIIESLMDRIQ